MSALPEKLTWNDGETYLIDQRLNAHSIGLLVDSSESTAYCACRMDRHAGAGMHSEDATKFSAGSILTPKNRDSIC